MLTADEVPRRILVIEDEPEMRTILQDNLQFDGYEVMLAESGEQALQLISTHRPDIVLLDLMLPAMNGYEVCRLIRAVTPELPIIMVSARNTDIDRIAGLELGADDYVGKPFNLGEMRARIRARLRGRSPVAPALAVTPPAPSEELRFGDLVVSLSIRQVHRGSRRIDLSEREFDLLVYLFAHHGQVVTREQLLADVWGYRVVPLTRTVDTFVAKLRRKIELDAANPRHIITVHGTGYRFVR